MADLESARLDPDEKEWAKHCQDTQGFLSQVQIFNLLIAEEICRVLPLAQPSPGHLYSGQGTAYCLGSWPGWI